MYVTKNQWTAFFDISPEHFDWRIVPKGTVVTYHMDNDPYNDRLVYVEDGEEFQYWLSGRDAYQIVNWVCHICGRVGGH